LFSLDAKETAPLRVLNSSVKSAVCGILAAILTVYCGYSIYEAFSTGMNPPPDPGIQIV
jgi:ABC-type transporter Mla maintaining outer membrane lipid asymmetry permease subunit MlaE